MPFQRSNKMVWNGKIDRCLRQHPQLPYWVKFCALPCTYWLQLTKLCVTSWDRNPHLWHTLNVSRIRYWNRTVITQRKTEGEYCSEQNETLKYRFRCEWGARACMRAHLYAIKLCNFTFILCEYSHQTHTAHKHTQNLLVCFGLVFRLPVDRSAILGISLREVLAPLQQLI